MTDTQISPWTKSPGEGVARWNGKSTYRLSYAANRLREMVANRRTVLRTLEEAEQAQRAEVAAEVAKLMGDVQPEELQVRFLHTCPSSPTRYCLYRSDDRLCVECLVCGQPEERT